MKDEEKTKDQLINELVELRQRFAEKKVLELGHKREREILERKIWLPVAGMFVLLFILVWLNEILDLPYLLLGAPQTPSNWHESIAEMVLIAGIGFFVVLRLIRDVTWRQLAEEALRKSEARYRHIVEDQTELICRFLPGGILTFVNDAYCRYFGKKREDLIGRSFISLIPEEGHAVVEKTLALLAQENPVATSEHQIILPDGEIGWQQWSDRAIFNNKGNFIEYQSVGRDITERKQMEEVLQKSHLILEQRVKERTAELLMKNEQLMKEIEDRSQAEMMLQESENKYRTVFETTGTATVILEEDTTISLANREFEKLSGYSNKELGNKKSWTEFVAEDEFERMKEFHRLRRLDPNAAPRNYEFTFIDRYGNVKNIFLTVAMISRTKRSVASFLDITERKQAEEALRESEEWSSIIASSAQDAIITMDNNGDITYWNDAAEKIFGYTEEEALGNELHIFLIPEKYHEAYNRSFLRFKETGQGAAVGKTLELTALKKDGKEFSIELSLSAVKIKDLWNATGIIRDITERKRAEEVLKTRERELEDKSRYLEEANIALKVLLKHQEDDKIEFQRDVLSNVKKLIMPYIEILKKPCSPADHSAHLDILQTNLNNIVSPFLRNITLNQFNLTPKEIQVANLVKDGKSTKEAADLMHLSIKAIEFHRKNIRAKLGLKHKNTNLQSYLLSLS